MMIASALHNALKTVQCGKRVLIQVVIDSETLYYEVMDYDIADGGEIVLAADQSQEAMM